MITYAPYKVGDLSLIFKSPPYDSNNDNIKFPTFYTVFYCCYCTVRIRHTRVLV